LARAKNTDRAEARRRHRDQQRVADDTMSTTTGDAESSVAPQASSQPASTSLLSAMKMPNVVADLRILPGMLLSTRMLWIPFIALLVAFFMVIALDKGLVPTGIDQFVQLYVTLTLPPTALFVFFVGGFLAPRASYLVGFVLGLFDALLITLITLLVSTGSTTESTGTEGSSGALAIWIIAPLVGTLSAGFAAWYRNFLRQSQEKARQNRMARDQAARAKAKEDERKARDEQRKAAAAARDASRKPAPSKSTTPPTT
jgi:hypothetical protein